MRNPEYQQIENKVVKILTQGLNLEAPAPDTDLFETGILDSQKFVELLLQLEKQFQAHISVEDFEVENFRSVSRIAALIAHRQERGDFGSACVPGPDQKASLSS